MFARQVSCNDWCLRRELASSYLLERLVGACERARVGAGHPEDEADIWTESSYFPLRPSRLQHKDKDYVAAWMQPCEVWDPATARQLPASSEISCLNKQHSFALDACPASCGLLCLQCSDNR